MAALLDILKKGVTSRSVTIRIIDSTDGTPETGVAYNTSGIDLWYRREGAAKVSITEATLAALTTAYASGGFIAIGDGEYRLDVPNAAFASGVNYVDIGGTVTGMIVIGGRVRLVDVDFEDAVRHGLTALPNAAAEASGGLPTLSAAQASNGTINANVHRWLTGTPNALQSGRVDGYLGAVAAGVIAAASFADAALDAVWGTTARVLTAGTNIVLAKGTGLTGLNDPSAASTASAVRVELAMELARVDAAVSTRSAPGAAMTLTSGERTAVANEVEAQIIDDTDSERVLQAMVDKIAAANPSLDDLTLGAIASAVRTELAAELARIDASISSRLATSSYTAPLSAAGVRSAIGLSAANLDTQLDALPTNAELATALAAADDAVLAAIAALNNVSTAQVRAQVAAALITDTYAEPSTIPAATASLKDKIGILAALALNKQTLTTSGAGVLRNSGDSANIGTRTDTDDGTTYTKGKVA